MAVKMNPLGCTLGRFKASIGVLGNGISIVDMIAIDKKYTYLFRLIWLLTKYLFDMHLNIGTWCAVDSDGLLYAWYDWLWPSSWGEGRFLWRKIVLLSPNVMLNVSVY